VTRRGAQIRDKPFVFAGLLGFVLEAQQQRGMDGHVERGTIEPMRYAALFGDRGRTAQ